MAGARMRWLLVVAAVCAAWVAAIERHRIADLVIRARTRLAVEQLTEGIGPEHLPQARFSSIPEPGTRSAARGGTSLDLTAEANAGRVLAVSTRSSSPDAIAATAAACMVAGDTARAIAVLEAGVREAPGEARLWSDLAGAYFEAGDVRRALVAADQALRIDRQFAGALHNRALILERLGLSSVAAEAWRMSLDATRDTQLAEVVREHLRVAEAPSERDRWRAVQSEFFTAAAAGDEAAVARVVGDFPRITRATAEATVLGEWGKTRGSDADQATRSLAIARNVGAVLRHRGETLVAEAVAVIDDATAQKDTGRLDDLARGHAAYDRGRRAYSIRDHASAKRDLREAAAAFQRARSPMEQVAWAWTASVLIDRSKIDEAHAILTGIVRGERKAGDGHRALLAHSLYLLAMCDTFRGRWNPAADGARESAALFQDLGETSNVGTSENLIADILDLLGQRDAGWEYRLRACRAANNEGALNRLLVAVGSGTRAAMRAGDHELALSLLDIEGFLAARVQEPVLTMEVFRRRAIVQDLRGAGDDRDTSLGRARAAVGGVRDVVERSNLTISLDAAEAVIVRKTNPKRAMELLGNAVVFSRQTERRFDLPAFLLERGRAGLIAGDAEQARRDFGMAMDELEAQRGAISDLDLRARLLDTAETLFGEAAALELRSGDPEAAFRVAERARARSLLDVLGSTAAPVASSDAVAHRLPAGTMLIEYVALPDRIAVFAIRNDGMRVDTVPGRASELSASTELAAMIPESLRDDVLRAKELIFVPDGELQRKAFGALRWNDRYLTETHTISVAPSASRLVATPGGNGKRPESVLVFGNPAADLERKLAPLPSVRREIEWIRPSYARSRVFFGPDATKSRFVTEAPKYDAIHFSGHGTSGNESLTASLLFAGERDSGRMDLEEITKLRIPRAPLVVLAACGTLRGRASGVEGMPSLARAFIAAGASSVVATLTDIDDERTAPLLTSFHRHIAAGQRPAEALRSAQLEAIARGGESADPKNWAQFVVYTATP